MTQNIPFGDRAGIATIESDTFTITPLFSGDGIDVVSDSRPMSASVVAALPQFTVLEQAADGLQPAVKASGHPLKGVLIAPYDPTVSTLKKAPVYLSGIFNPAALNWDASLAAAADQEALFNEADPWLILRAIGSPAS